MNATAETVCLDGDGRPVPARHAAIMVQIKTGISPRKAAWLCARLADELSLRASKAERPYRRTDDNRGAGHD